MHSKFVDAHAIPSMFLANGVKPTGEMTILPPWVPPIFFILSFSFLLLSAITLRTRLPPGGARDDIRHEHVGRRGKPLFPARASSSCTAVVRGGPGQALRHAIRQHWARTRASAAGPWPPSSALCPSAPPRKGARPRPSNGPNKNSSSHRIRDTN
jgi:hypothetical protein